jgi:glucokinase
MTANRSVFLGTDGGATISKTAGVWDDGTAVSMEMLQTPTNAAEGPQATVRAWLGGLDAFLAQHGLAWDRVAGVGLSIPGPYQRYGVFDKSPNLPDSFTGFDVYQAYSAALADIARRPVPLVVGNDGNFGGVAEAQRLQAVEPGSVVLLAPGSGLGCAYVDAEGFPLDGDTLAGMEAAHMPAPLHELGARAYPCGCGRTWGCVEVYTTLSGLPYLIAERLPQYPGHELHDPALTPRQRALALRGLAQRGDELAQSVFDFQARALGFHVATLVMALDPRHIVVGGGLMEPGATTTAFRERYLSIVRETARPWLWPPQRDRVSVVAAELGDLSQAIGAALVAFYRARRGH